MVCVRHVLDSHLVLQFNCTNTVKEQVGAAPGSGEAEAVEPGRQAQQLGYVQTDAGRHRTSSHSWATAT